MHTAFLLSPSPLYGWRRSETNATFWSTLNSWQIEGSRVPQLEAGDNRPIRSNTLWNTAHPCHWIL